jgi:hypothetical protein
MTVTAKLYRLFLVDKQIRGLRSRLDAAEKFLGQQEKHLDQIAAQRKSIEQQTRLLQASVANDEGEAKQLSTLVDEIRERMNTAKSNKEYKALLTEMSTFKDKQTEAEARVLAGMEKLDALKARLGELDNSTGERQRVRGVAAQDRNARQDEIAGKLSELEAQRKTLAADVPADALRTYEALLRERGEDAMAPLEIIDPKRHEFVCGSSMMSVPVEVAANLMKGNLTISPADGCILYLPPESEERLAKVFKR